MPTETENFIRLKNPKVNEEDLRKSGDGKLEIVGQSYAGLDKRAYEVSALNE